MDFTNTGMLRKKAEEHLKKNREKMRPQAPETDVNRLLHELQVHQIELEMQNEELRLAYQKVEAALKKYTLLYDLAPMGYFTLNYDGSIMDLNFTGANILSDKRFALISKNFKLFLSESSLPVFNHFFDKVFSSESKESCQVMLAYNKQPLRLVYMEGVVIESGQKCLLSVVDISEFTKQNNF